MRRRLITLAVVVLIAHVGWKVGPVYLNYFQFRNQLEGIARLSVDRTEEEIGAQVMGAAQKYQIPLAPHGVVVRKLAAERTLIDVSYTQPIEVLPRFSYEWQVAINIDSYIVKLRFSDTR